MSEQDEKPASLPAKPRNGQFVKGKSGNPKGRGKGNLSKTTKFLQVMTQGRQQKALKVLDNVLKEAEAGDKDSQKMVMEVLKPFLRREAEAGDGTPRDKRPTVVINVNRTDGLAAPKAQRVLEG